MRELKMLTLCKSCRVHTRHWRSNGQSLCILCVKQKPNPNSKNPLMEVTCVICGDFMKKTVGDNQFSRTCINCKIRAKVSFEQIITARGQ